jgi:hypothetical protein
VVACRRRAPLPHGHCEKKAASSFARLDQLTQISHTEQILVK